MDITESPARGPELKMDELLREMTNEQLELLRDCDSIADDFLSSNFKYRDGSNDAVINEIKHQNLNLARSQDCAHAVSCRIPVI